MKVSSLAEPTLFLFTKIELPLILISFLSIPLSMRALLSLRSVDSVFLSAIVMKGFRNTLGWSNFDILCRLARTVAASQGRANLMIKGLALSSEYLPILEQSQTAYSLNSGHIDCMVLQARSVS